MTTLLSAAFADANGTDVTACATSPGGSSFTTVGSAATWDVQTTYGARLACTPTTSYTFAYVLANGAATPTEQSCKATIASFFTSGVFGVICNYQDVNNLAGFRWNDFGPYLECYTIVGGTETSHTLIDGSFDKTVEHEFKVERVGSTLKAYLDGVYKSALDHPCTLTGGKGGMASFSSNSGLVKATFASFLWEGTVAGGAARPRLGAGLLSAGLLNSGLLR